MRYLSVPILLLLLLVACKKSGQAGDGRTCTGDCYTLSGYVVDTPGLAPVAGAKIFIMHTNLNRSEVFGPVYSDSRGYYELRFPAEGMSSITNVYNLMAAKDGYLTTDNGSELAANLSLNGSTATPLQQQVHLFHPAQLELRIRASNLPAGRELFYTHVFNPARYGGGITSHGIAGGRPIDSTVRYTTAGDLPTYLTYGRFDYNIEHHDTVVIPRGTTRLVEINL